MRKTLLIVLLAIIAIAVALIDATYYWYADLKDVPPLKSGDLIFETSLTNQTLAIILATRSPYTHVGIVHPMADGSIMVIHAGATVIESTLSEFLAGGWGQRFTVMRYPDLSDAQRAAIVHNAEQYLGTPYNYIFYMDGEGVYCSELPYLAFRKAGAPIGALEKIGDLHVDNFAVHSLFNKRWQMHPLCQASDMTATACWNLIMDLPVITPADLAHDPHLNLVYSNYLIPIP